MVREVRRRGGGEVAIVAVDVAPRALAPARNACRRVARRRQRAVVRSACRQTIVGWILVTGVADGDARGGIDARGEGGQARAPRRRRERTVHGREDGEHSRPHCKRMVRHAAGEQRLGRWKTWSCMRAYDRSASESRGWREACRPARRAATPRCRRHSS